MSISLQLSDKAGLFRPVYSFFHVCDPTPAEAEGVRVCVYFPAELDSMNAWR